MTTDRMPNIIQFDFAASHTPIGSLVTTGIHNGAICQRYQIVEHAGPHAIGRAVVESTIVHDDNTRSRVLRFRDGSAVLPVVR